ncbi:MAG TPA: hypothetical protein VKH81_06385 [Candidatus Angelobacter sp.]|nr:hypothetical protein [Candidatus Angelobacter sp.]
MWPLSLVLLFATAAPQQPAAPPQLTAQQKQLLESARQKAEKAAKASEYQLLHARNTTCYTLRSYFFHPQDGQAPVPAGMTTCTPANKFRQRWVTIEPGMKYPAKDLKILDQQSAQKDNTCFTMRSYYFRRQDGQAPVLASTSTCTPASKLQQRQVGPGGMLVPMGFSGSDQKPAK